MTNVMNVDVAAPLAFIAPPRYHPLHSKLCSTQGRVLARPFSFAGTGGRGRNAIRATDRQTGQTEELSALQSRENGRKRAVPPLPLQTAGAHAPAAARHRTAGGVDRRQRLARRCELFRRPLQVHPRIRRGTLAIVSILQIVDAQRLGNMSPRIALVEFFPSWPSTSGM